MVKVTIGIDIGLKGSIAVLNTVDPTNTTRRGVRVWDIPTKKIKKLCTKGKRHGKMNNLTVYDIDRIRDILIEIHDLNIGDAGGLVCFIEKAIIKPCGYNIKTHIGLARCQAIFEGLLSALRIECHTVTPQDWQKAMGLTGKHQSGNANVQIAMQKHPTIVFKTKKGRVLDGRADALLIAEFGRDLWVEKEIPNKKTQKAMNSKSVGAAKSVDEAMEKLDEDEG